jgi:aspartate/methionine/tyrosine aminotransferase
VVTARSLTKAFGLSWLRCGWLQGPPALLRRALEVNDYAAVFLPAPSALGALAALADDEARRAGAAARAREGWAMVARRLGGHPAVGLVAPCPEAPVISFPRLDAADAGPLVAELLARHGVAIAPGRLFGAPAHARIASLSAPAALDEGLAALAALLG